MQTRASVIKKPIISREFLLLIAILFLSLTLRLAFISVFPTIPVSDFHVIVSFAKLFAEDFFARGHPGWGSINPGLPFFLSFLLRIIPAQPELVARWATALLTGSLPLIPFLVWRGVFPLPARSISALLLAVWPAQIIFSGVIAQDNWVLFPTIFLVSLAVRVLIRQENGYPVLGAVLYALAGFIRQEMLAVLVPAFLICLYSRQKASLWPNIIRGASSLLLCLLLMIGQRGLATGQYGLTTSHFRVSLLGSYIPGAGLSWQDPKPYIAATAPHLLTDNQHYHNNELFLLTWKEIQRRPFFYLVRLFSFPLTEILDSERKVAYWSLAHPDALPDVYSLQVKFFMTRVVSYFNIFTHITATLFIFSVFYIFLVKKYRTVVVFLLLTILAKIALHAILVAQARFFLASTAIAVLVIGVMAANILNFIKAGLDRKKTLLLSLVFVAAIAGYFTLNKAQEAGVRFVTKHDVVPQYNYRFQIQVKEMIFTCSMREGRLRSYYLGALLPDNEGVINISLLNADPSVGEKAELACSSENDVPLSNIRLSVSDYYERGDYPNRLRQVLYINNEKVLDHDMAAEAWHGYHDFDLLPSDDGKVSFRFSIIAGEAEQGWNWGAVSYTVLKFSEAPP